MAGVNNKPNEMTSILNFRIFHVTSQDHEFPAQDLVSLGKNTNFINVNNVNNFNYREVFKLIENIKCVTTETKWMAVATLLHIPTRNNSTI
jgi:hypothetical protein